MLAYKNAARGKRGNLAVARFEYALGDELIALQRELRDRSYQPSGYHSFYIHEPKRRLISAAAFRDRVVHHALCNITVPSYEQQFFAHSYANRVGKGSHLAIDRCQHLARQYPYVLQCDIKQFFPSIHHGLLRKILQGMLPHGGQDLMWLISRILNSGMAVVEGSIAMSSGKRGLPIGNLTSQWWGNCYLNPLDQFVQRELGCMAYVRYVDDFMLFAPTLAQLHTWRSAIIARLAKYRLTLHEAQAQPKPVTEGIAFLGFHVFASHRRLKPRKGKAFQRKFARILAAGDVEYAQASLRAWINHVRYANTYGLRRAMLARFNLLNE